MIKRFVLPLALVAISIPNIGTANAETEAAVAAESPKTITLGASGFGAMPIGDLGDAVDMGIGVVASIDYPINPQLEVTGRIGYIHFVTDADGFSFSNIPLWGGVRYFLNPDPESVYLHGESGFNMFRVSVDTQFGDASDSETELALNLLAGKKFGSLVAEGGLYIGSLDEVDDTLMIGGTIGKTF